MPAQRTRPGSGCLGYFSSSIDRVCKPPSENSSSSLEFAIYMKAPSEETHAGFSTAWHKLWYPSWSQRTIYLTLLYQRDLLNGLRSVLRAGAWTSNHQTRLREEDRYHEQCRKVFHPGLDSKIELRGLGHANEVHEHPSQALDECKKWNGCCKEPEMSISCYQRGHLYSVRWSTLRAIAAPEVWMYPDSMTKVALAFAAKWDSCPQKSCFEARLMSAITKMMKVELSW
ncbi:hypothetical protein BDZ97DRAFT_1757245 [Flammula alnicola]|nr:hypothetical protein BDZ97DRAFT_1757245 [Flammula alnicola]